MNIICIFMRTELYRPTQSSTYGNRRRPIKYSPENFQESIELSSWRGKHAESDFLGLLSFKILTSGDRQERCLLLSLHLVKEHKRSASAIALLINGGLPTTNTFEIRFRPKCTLYSKVKHFSTGII